VGFGKVAAGYATDEVMSRYFPYASHAQILADHPDFDWDIVVDPSEEARMIARDRWNVPMVLSDLSQLDGLASIEVLIIATPPEQRLSLINSLQGIRAVLVEKPLGGGISEAVEFVDQCRAKDILLQVNFWRRADTAFRALSNGELTDRIGKVQAAFVTYGNGLRNNGSHMVDFVRMLLGEVVGAQALATGPAETDGPIPGDIQFPFSLYLQNGLNVMFQSLRFKHYREIGLDLWGEKGRLSIMQEGLSLNVFPIRENRAMKETMEVASDKPEAITSTVGSAFYGVYDNLSSALSGSSKLYSPGESALRTTMVIEAVLSSFEQGGRFIPL
jgi:predicted dehydrogenase